MNKKAYHDEFIRIFTEKGFNKKASEEIYKEAGRIGILKQLWRGLSGVARGFGDIAIGAGRGAAHGARGVGKGLEWLNNSNGLKINSRLARSFESGKLSKVPLVRSFGEGFAKAQRAYEAKKNVGNSLMAGIGLGKGGIIGNSLAGMGTFTSAHPYLGALGWTLPAALIANNLSKKNDEEGTIDTMTPAQRRAYDRIFRANGYSGLGFDADDVDSFGAL